MLESGKVNLNITISESEHSELLAKLANEIESYGDKISPHIESVFVKIVENTKIPNYETTLVKKYKSKFNVRSIDQI